MDVFQYYGDILKTEKCVISFSGGRSSAFLTKKLLDGAGGRFGENVVVSFQNTGLEHEETLNFVQKCSEEWNIDIQWLEYQSHTDHKKRWKKVKWETAARKGEPFKALVRDKNFCPNPVMRFCTTHLKVMPCQLFVKEKWGKSNYTQFMGIRADERKRFKMEGIDPLNKRRERVLPLKEAKITESDVNKFWAENSFDLKIKSYMGNCVLCFLKGTAKKQRIIRENPEVAGPWIEMETAARGTFHKKIAIKDLVGVVQKSPLLPIFDTGGEISCFCGD